MCVCACVIAKYYTVEVASKQTLTVKQYPLIFLKRFYAIKRFIRYKTAGTLTFLFTLCMECCGDASCLRIPINREESNVRKDKRITMAQ